MLHPTHLVVLLLSIFSCDSRGRRPRGQFGRVISEFQKPRFQNEARKRLLGSLSSNVFERHTSTGSERFSLLIYLDATKLVLLSVFTLKERFCPRVCSKSRPKSAKSPHPVDVRRSKTSLLKLPIFLSERWYPS